MNIYTTGLIGYETARRLYEENKALFEARFPKFFLREFVKLSEKRPSAGDFLDDLCIEKNTKNLYSRKNFYFDGRQYLREIKEGGIFAALWAACEDLEEIKKTDALTSTFWGAEKLQRFNSFGCEVKLEDIPLDQHVVEIMELLKESPYEVSSAGSYLVISVAEHGFGQNTTGDQDNDEYSVNNKGADLLKNPELKKIGEITESKARVIISGETQRFLTPPERQKQDISDRNSYRKK